MLTVAAVASLKSERDEGVCFLPLESPYLSEMVVGSSGRDDAHFRVRTLATGAAAAATAAAASTATTTTLLSRDTLKRSSTGGKKTEDSTLSSPSTRTTIATSPLPVTDHSSMPPLEEDEEGEEGEEEATSPVVDTTGNPVATPQRSDRRTSFVQPKPKMRVLGIEDLKALSHQEHLKRGKFTLIIQKEQRVTLVLLLC